MRQPSYSAPQPEEPVTPSVPELEETVLGAALIETTAMTEISGLLRAEMFYETKHVKIFAVLERMQRAGLPIDLLTVAEELRGEGSLEEIGGAYYLAVLAGRVASSAHLVRHACIIRQYYFRRQLILGLSKMLSCAVDLTVETEATVIDAQQMLENILNDSPWQDNLRAMPQLIDETLLEGEQRVLNSVNGVTGIPTGLEALDRKTGGWQKKELTVIAARPGVGKTAFMLHTALTAAQNGFHALVFSLEMSSSRLGDRWLLSSCNVNPYAWKAGKLSQAEWEEIQQAGERLRTLPIQVDDTAGVCIDELCVAAKTLRAKGKCDIVFIDYLQLCTVRSEDRLREQEVAECSRKAKALAKQIDCPVIVLSQLNRTLENRPGQVPRLSDLRESGAIEQDADIVLMLYRPALHGLPSDLLSHYPSEGLGVGIIAKNRNGETDRVYFRHNPSLTKIEDYKP